MTFSQRKRRGKHLDESRRGDERISRTRNGNVLSPFVTPANMNGLETMALTEIQQEKAKVCEKQPGKNNRESKES